MFEEGKTMKKLFALLTVLFLLFGSAACAETTSAVVCYSRADENYSVGYISGCRCPGGVFYE